jgi:hypothetical protein
VFLPVPSGLFHTGHVPGDRPYWRAGYDVSTSIILSSLVIAPQNGISNSLSGGEALFGTADSSR